MGVHIFVAYAGLRLFKEAKYRDSSGKVGALLLH